MTADLGFWTYQPASGRMSWRFPGGVAFEALDDLDRARLQAALAAAANPALNAPVLQECRVAGHRAEDERWVAVYGGALAEIGRSRRVCGVVVDVSERRRREAMAGLIVGELNHRAGNIVAVAQAIASRTLRSSESLAQARVVLAARLSAMADGWRFGGDAEGRNNDIGAILDRTLVAVGQRDRCDTWGPPAPIQGRAAPALSLVLHELATNAVKHGALSGDTGRVAVCWRRRHDGRLQLEWREHGGPAVGQPAHRGFGSQLVERALSGDGARVRVAFHSEGLFCQIAGLPLRPDIADASASPGAGDWDQDGHPGRPQGRPARSRTPR